MQNVSYAELHVTTSYSFLRGVSHPEELFAQAATLGINAFGVADWNSVAGIVRAWEAAKVTGVRLVAGARLGLVDGAALLAFSEDRAGWSRLSVPAAHAWQGPRGQGPGLSHLRRDARDRVSDLF